MIVTMSDWKISYFIEALWEAELIAFSIDLRAQFSLWIFVCCFLLFEPACCIFSSVRLAYLSSSFLAKFSMF